MLGKLSTSSPDSFRILYSPPLLNTTSKAKGGLSVSSSDRAFRAVTHSSRCGRSDGSRMGNPWRESRVLGSAIHPVQTRMDGRSSASRSDVRALVWATLESPKGLVIGYHLQQGTRDIR